MKDIGSQPKLIGFAGDSRVNDPSTLGLAIRAELQEMAGFLGPRMTAMANVENRADLLFLRACVELRIPVILVSPYSRQRLAEEFQDPEEWTMAQHLIGVALAKYVVPEGKDPVEAAHRYILEFADAFLFAWHGDDNNRTGELVTETRALGIPARVIHAEKLSSDWSFEPDPERGARHGFESRKDLLEFFDARLPYPF